MGKITQNCSDQMRKKFAWVHRLLSSLWWISPRRLSVYKVRVSFVVLPSKNFPEWWNLRYSLCEGCMYWQENVEFRDKVQPIPSLRDICPRSFSLPLSLQVSYRFPLLSLVFVPQSNMKSTPFSLIPYTKLYVSLKCFLSWTLQFCIVNADGTLLIPVDTHMLSAFCQTYGLLNNRILQSLAFCLRKMMTNNQCSGFYPPCSSFLSDTDIFLWLSTLRCYRHNRTS